MLFCSIRLRFGRKSSSRDRPRAARTSAGRSPGRPSPRRSSSAQLVGDPAGQRDARAAIRRGIVTCRVDARRPSRRRARPRSSARRRGACPAARARPRAGACQSRSAVLEARAPRRCRSRRCAGATSAPGSRDREVGAARQRRRPPRARLRVLAQDIGAAIAAAAPARAAARAATSAIATATPITTRQDAEQHDRIRTSAASDERQRHAATASAAAASASELRDACGAELASASSSAVDHAGRRDLRRRRADLAGVHPLRAACPGRTSPSNGSARTSRPRGRSDRAACAAEVSAGGTSALRAAVLHGHAAGEHARAAPAR